ncbi:DUF2461 family protein [Gemmatimonadota bacterium Y43]|uniref:DUF2461 family protein n=1 Tax=Gaopeijia maritima TaxID=3119007 RepID=UPI0032844A22
MGMFVGFPREGLALLARLPRFDKTEFDASRNAYRSGLQDPAKAFVTDLGAALLADLGAEVEAVPRTNGSIGPINNDLRFNPDGARYKDHLLFRFWEGPAKKTAPTLFVRLTSDEVGFAAGCMFGDVAVWRAAVDAEGDGLAAALAEVHDARDATVVGQELKRVPTGYPAEHPHADLLRHKWLQVRWSTPLPGSVDGPEFVDYCVEELRGVLPVHRWLVEAFS